MSNNLKLAIYYGDWINRTIKKQQVIGLVEQ